MSNLVPDGWREVVLGEHAHIKARIGWRGLSSSEYTESGPYLIAGTHIRGESVDWENCHHINKFRYDESPEIQLQDMDVIISKDGTIGRLGFIENMPGLATINGTMMLIRPDDNFYSKFIYFYLQGNKFQKIVREKVSGSSVPHIFQRDMVTLAVPLPPFPEQQKIAKILTSIDEVIEKTQAQIDKLKDLKTGMMQELLTNGIGHTEFKDSPVGRIPAEWEIVRINELVTKVGSGVTPKGGSKAYVSTGIPLIRSQNVHSDGLRLDNVSFITYEQHQKMKGSQLQPKDVLLNITGASIGRCYYLPDNFTEGNVNQHVCIIRLKQEVISHVFLTLLLNGQLGQSQIMSLQAGGNREGLNFQQIREIKLPLPSLEEQTKISSALSSVERKIRIKESKSSAITKTKKALMQDLLTGKVRVKVDS